MQQGPIRSFVALNPQHASVGLMVDANGALIAGDGSGASPLAGNTFRGANQSGVTTTIALATTYVGIVLSNPAGSEKNLLLGRVAAQLNVAPANLTAFGLFGGWDAAGITAHTTPLTPANSFLNEAAPVGKLDAAATLVGTPAWLDWLGETPGATSVVSVARDYAGSIVIPPGGYVGIGTLIASSASGFLGAMSWAEVDA
jgi:hypothetical protein